jgi:hypothetical protein
MIKDVIIPKGLEKPSRPIEGEQNVMLGSSVPDRLVCHREPVQNPTLARDPRPVTPEAALDTLSWILNTELEDQ